MTKLQMAGEGTNVMRVRVVSTAEQLNSIEEAWSRLTVDQPFVGPAWMAVWWRFLGARPECRLTVLVVEDEARRIVAIAPWYSESTFLHGNVLRFLGSGEVCTDYLTIPCLAGYERSAAAALASWLSKGHGSFTCPHKWQTISLEGVRADDPIIQMLCQFLAGSGALVDTTSAPSCWRLELPESWEEYLSQLSKSHRKRVRRLERAYFETGRAKVVTARTAAERARGFRLLVSMHEKRWQTQGLGGSFRDAAVYSFHQEATATLQVRGQLRLNWLELDGRPVAAEYSLVAGGVIYGYQSGMDPDAADHEPGSLTLIATLRGAIEEGMQAMDFLRGDEAYKQHWRARPCAMQNIRLLPNQWQGRIRQVAWRAAQGTRRWLRPGLLPAGRQPEADATTESMVGGQKTALESVT